MAKKSKREAAKSRKAHAPADVPARINPNFEAGKIASRNYAIVIVLSLAASVIVQYLMGRFLLGQVRWDIMAITTIGFGATFGLAISLSYIAKKRAGY